MIRIRKFICLNIEVRCVKAGRSDNSELNFFEKGLQDHINATFVSTSYSHHQKTIICDAPALACTRTRKFSTASPEQNPRRFVAFLGGLDITDGRWDTPKHELFSTLNDEHKDDFYQKFAPGVEKRHGPREPWHDIRSKLEGPIAFDVFQNFLERWNKQGPSAESPLVDTSIMHIIKNSQLSSDEDDERWSCRLLRSITDDSAAFDHPHKVSYKQNKKVEMSILEAYVHAIRKAQNFIYIENQYFYGSSYMWDCLNKPSCHHIIPSEIAHKIASQIRNHKRFVAYIVVPMFPEGDPASGPLQEILNYQHKTMEMMYKIIASALNEVGSRQEPKDYLFFLCPAKRESHDTHMSTLEKPVEGVDTPMAVKLRESLRCPIYVHSKMMIVDDVYIIVGSANINQRSMAGTRDTEIAVSGRQDKYGIDNPSGDISAFRKSLFNEHFVEWHKEFEEPSSMECVKKVQKLILENWTNYMGPSGSVTKGHMLPYPVFVKPDGKLTDFIGIQDGCFPDFDAKIKGKRINLSLTNQHQRVLT